MGRYADGKICGWADMHICGYGRILGRNCFYTVVYLKYVWGRATFVTIDDALVIAERRVGMSGRYIKVADRLIRRDSFPD
jgi:hypothetical protein